MTDPDEPDPRLDAVLEALNGLTSAVRAIAHGGTQPTGFEALAMATAGESLSYPVGKALEHGLYSIANAISDGLDRLADAIAERSASTADGGEVAP